MKTAVCSVLLLIALSPAFIVSKMDDQETMNPIFEKISKKINKMVVARIEKKDFPYMNSKAADYYVNTWPEKPKPRPPHYP